ncbi:AAA domain-containing protein [Corynebacterium alimapuense]|uniref:AAA domain-containing protein n=1 Tax=Corynebacterium alimapuense TaxID=1576874 RepID=UPI000F800817|nr:AAA domain-containing protein [Corynebacterium alimapuense]
MKEKQTLSVQGYSKEGAVFWLAELREYSESCGGQLRFGSTMSAVLTESRVDSSEGDTDLVIELPRPHYVDFPELDKALEGRLSNDGLDPFRRPEVMDKDGATSDSVGAEEEVSESDPIAWLEQWEKWAENERYRQLYEKMFDLQTKANQQADEFELILGLGSLYWAVPDGETIDRPLFTVDLAVTMDKHSGQIDIRLNGDVVTPELEVVPPEKMTDARFIVDVKAEVEALNGDILSPDTFRELGQLTANSLSTNAVYEDNIARPSRALYPRICWAPCIILRRRRRTGLAVSFARIAEEILETGRIPAGLAALIDVNDISQVKQSAEAGAMYVNDDDIFSPLPLNDRQKAVIERVDRNAQTIVQGPPGTGKTHMAAALLSHLLAQGKRVLVTAETDRALYELRDKMPAEIQKLAVSVIGTGSSNMADDLRVTIDTIARRSSDFDDAESRSRIGQLTAELETLGEQRVRSVREWTARIGEENSPVASAGYEMPVARAIEKWLSESDQNDWIKAIEIRDLHAPFPLTAEETNRWLELLEDPRFEEHESLSNADTINLDAIKSAAAFEALCVRLKKAAEDFRLAASHLDPDALHSWKSLSSNDQTLVMVSLEQALKLESSVEKESHPWSAELRAAANGYDVSAKRTQLENLQLKLRESELQAGALGGLKRLTVSDGALEDYIPIARSLEAYLTGGGEVPTRPDGSVKPPMFGKRIIREAMPFFTAVRIDGLAATTLPQVQKFLAFVEVTWVLQDLYRSWPHFVPGDVSDPVGEMTACRTTLREFENSLERHAELNALIAALQGLGINARRGALEEDLQSVKQLDRVCQYEKSLHDERIRFDSIERNIRILQSEGHGLQWLETLTIAVEQRDPALYAEALDKAQEAYGLASAAREFAPLSHAVLSWSEELYDRVREDPHDGEWHERLRRAEPARQWLAAGQLLEKRGDTGLNRLQEDISRIEKRITATVTDLAAERAWAYAVGSSRIDPAMRSNLVAYTQAVGRLGKGTGKYADFHRRDVRRHLDSCRAAVPVWIMPLFRVIDQFKLEENMFDVIIVDEASQAGVDAIFLQYLAPRIVVIGDQKQVSPSGVGVDRKPIIHLAHQYLYDFDKIDSWTDPTRSLFDDAEMRYGERIVLREHRRCVPEIIEFSNKIAYRPNSIELIPVREVFSGRLAPFKVTRTPHAAQPVTKKKVINIDEADVLIERLIQGLEDPAYEGKTMGVISLLSTSGQAEYLKNRLLEKLSPEVWEQRDLKVGSPAEFQGAERDVIFLSMVSMVPIDGAQRLSVIATDMYIQRYNVAVSRAKDQVWLFHSAGVENLDGRDIRAQLLQHAYDVATAAPEVKSSSLVSDDVRVELFDSLFEQRVYNGIVAKGYFVVPQFDAYGYRLDLVVEGANGRLAIECDGDYWHGESQARADRARQRELERLGWRFVRIFESDFYLDKQEQLQRVFDALEERGIRPYSLEQAGAESLSNIEIVDSRADIDTTIDFHAELPESQEYGHEQLDLPAIRVRARDSETSVATEEDSDDYDADFIEVYEESSRVDIWDGRGEQGELLKTDTIVPLTRERDLFSVAPEVSVETGKDSTQPANEESSVDETEKVSAALPHTSATTGWSPATINGEVQGYQFEDRYQMFRGSCVSVHSASDEQIIEGLLEILTIEGPMLGHVLISRYVKAGGDHRVTRPVKKTLNSVISRLVSRRMIRFDNPTDVAGNVGKTFHLPKQPSVIVRTRGERDLADIPYGELRAVMGHVVSQSGLDDSEVVMRETLKAFDLIKLTGNAKNLLDVPFQKIREESFN